MRNIKLLPDMTRIRRYELQISLMLSLVPLFCCILLTALIFFFAQQNLYFLENSGMLIKQEVRQAFHDQIQMELLDVAWYVVALVALTFAISFFLIRWAVSPFVNAEKMLRTSLTDLGKAARETDWLSESPAFHKVIWNFAQTLRNKNHPFDNFDPARYKFNYRFFLKFVATFYVISMATGYILGIIFDTVYMKIVNLAITLVRMDQKGYYFLAQEELLRIVVVFMVIFSCFVYAMIGYYVTRYMSNMLFVFTRAVREHHFPLRLRHSDIYHTLADAISEVAAKAGIGKK